MDLYCPHCTRRVTVPDDQAGQATSCPLCAKQFMAPALAPTGAKPAAPPPAPKPPPPPVAPSPPPVSTAPAPAPVESYSMEPAPVPPPSPPPTLSQPAPPTVPPVAPTPPGEHTRSCECQLTGDWLAFVPPACVLAIFVLSAFNWHYHDSRDAFSLWSLSFGQAPVGQTQFLGYTILMILCLPLTVVAMLFDKSWIVAPPPLAPFVMWKNLLIGLILGLAFLALCSDYVRGYLLVDRANPIALAMELAFRLHLIALVSSFVMFWLGWRKSHNLPAPTVEMHW